MPRPRAVGHLLFFLLFSTSAFAQATFDAVRKTEQIYEAGEYHRALEEVDSQLMRDFELSHQDRARLYLMKARLLYAFDRIAEIPFWLRKAHASDPGIALDPLLDPPVMIDAMRKIRTEEGTVTDDEAMVQSRDRLFFVGIMPFGIGHMDAGKVKEGSLFLATESLLLVSSHTLASDSSRSSTLFLGMMSFLGTYSYELLDMLPELMARDREKTDTLRFVMNFAPFGAAQAKNGDLGKAFGFAALQSVLLTLGTVTDDEKTRTVAFSVLGASWLFSMIDGFSSYPDSASTADSSLRFFAGVSTGRPMFGARLIW